ALGAARHGAAAAVPVDYRAQSARRLARARHSEDGTKMSGMAALKATDPEIYDLIVRETRRQDDFTRLIPSEKYASHAVTEATGATLNNKSSEGYPGKRYYEGQDYIDQIETLAIERAKALFGAAHANVQPYSGSPANQAVYL